MRAYQVPKAQVAKGKHHLACFAPDLDPAALEQLQEATKADHVAASLAMR
jgi:hypothetical protein